MITRRFFRFFQAKKDRPGSVSGPVQAAHPHVVLTVVDKPALSVYDGSVRRDIGLHIIDQGFYFGVA
jgi:hypothetical protein